MNTLMNTLINRQFGAAFSVLLICQAMVSGVASNIGITPVRVEVLWILIWTGIIWTGIANLIATAIERRMWPLAAGAAICFVVASVWMEWRIYAMMVTTGVIIVNVAVIWWPDSESGDSLDARLRT